MTVPHPIPRQTVYYPETDGKPMAETDDHRDQMVLLIEALRLHFAERVDVYVAGNLLLYYEEGNPQASVAPDVFVVFGVPKHRRRIYKLWEENKAPDVVFEITSLSTRLEDLGTKRALYNLLGVTEYFLYDPLHEYLDTPLQGYCLEGREYQPIAMPDGDSAMRMYSRVLDLELRVIDGWLRLIEPNSGRVLPTLLEAEAARQAAETARQAAEAARQAAEERAEREARARQTVEAELARLQDELSQLRSQNKPDST